MVIKIKTLIALLLYYWVFSIVPAFADNCGVPLPQNPADEIEPSAYHHIKNLINIKPENCNLEEEKIKFCLSGDTNCPEIELRRAGSVELSSLYTSYPEIAINPYFADIVLSSKKIAQSICVVMPTSFGAMPIVCRSAEISESEEIEKKCRIISDRCGGDSFSKVPFGFSGGAIDCVTSSLDKIFYRYSECSFEEQEVTLLAGFALFQERMKAAVRAALILYVMFLGIDIILRQDQAEAGKILMSAFKVIAVSYFSVGIGPILFVGNAEVTSNGVVDLLLPLMKELTVSLANIAVSASVSGEGLCQFDPASYERGYEFYALWDMIDCRVGKYFGFSTIAARAQLESTPLSILLSFGYFAMIFQLLMASNIIAAMAMVVFAILFFSIIIYFISHYVVCLITLYVMSYVSPIFVPMALFKRTKNYFDSWMKILLSCIAQPFIVAGFIAIILNVYDSAFYENCEFRRVENGGMIDFEITLPPEDAHKCKGSPGYILEQYFTGKAFAENKSFLIFSTKVLYNPNLAKAMMYLIVISIILFYFFRQIGQFASDITYGPNMSSAIADPMAAVRAGASAASATVLAPARKGANKIKDKLSGK